MPEITEQKARPVDTVLRPKKHGRTFDRNIGVIKTLPWVIPITIIIWIYAEREQVGEPETATFPLAVRIDVPNRIVTLEDPSSSQITATLKGPSVNVRKVIEQLKANPDHPAITFTVPAEPRAARRLFRPSARSTTMKFFTRMA